MEFLEKLVSWVKNIKVSDPLEEGCRLGPVVSEGQVSNFVPKDGDYFVTKHCFSVFFFLCKEQEVI